MAGIIFGYEVSEIGLHVNLGLLMIFSKRQRITLRLLNAIAIPSVVSVCLSVCDVGVPYSAG